MSFLADRNNLRRALAIAVCLVIFLFTFQVMPDLHGQGLVHQNYPEDSHKARFEASSFKTVLPAIIVFWFAVGGVFYLLFRGQPLVQRVFSSLVTHDALLLYRRQFLRPPPLSLS